MEHLTGILVVNQQCGSCIRFTKDRTFRWLVSCLTSAPDPAVSHEDTQRLTSCFACVFFFIDVLLKDTPKYETLRHPWRHTERERKPFGHDKEKKPHTVHFHWFFFSEAQTKLLHSSICPPNERQIHCLSTKSIFIHLSRVNLNVPDYSEPGRTHKGPRILHFTERRSCSGSGECQL